MVTMTTPRWTVWLALAALPLGACRPHDPPLEPPPERPDSRGCDPVRIAVLQDGSGSRDRTRTPVLAWGDLQPLLGLVERCGGELRVGEIRDSRPASFAALRIAPPPAAAGPRPWPGNPFLRAEAQRAARQEEAAAAADHARWREETDRALAEFQSALEARWRPGRLAPRTDVWSALARAELFLGEPQAGLDRPARRWLLAVTDGEHTAGRPAAELRLDPATTLVLVNGEGRQGDLASLTPHRFEALAAATRWIVEKSVRPAAAQEVHHD